MSRFELVELNNSRVAVWSVFRWGVLRWILFRKCKLNALVIPRPRFCMVCICGVGVTKVASCFKLCPKRDCSVENCCRCRV